MANINPNQFAQVPVRGQLDLQISKSGVIQGVVSASQASAMKAGDAVKLDTTSGVVPSFLAAGTTDVAIGNIVFDEKKAAPIAGDAIQVALDSGPAVVMWCAAGATIVAGASVEDATVATMQTLASGKMRGVALDPGTSGSLFRVIIRNALQS